MKDKVNTSSILFSGKEKKKKSQHISLITFDHISTVHSECSSRFICYCVYVELFIGSISKISSDKISMFKFTNIQLIY